MPLPGRQLWVCASPGGTGLPGARGPEITSSSSSKACPSRPEVPSPHCKRRGSTDWNNEPRHWLSSMIRIAVRERQQDRLHGVFVGEQNGGFQDVQYSIRSGNPYKTYTLLARPEMLENIQDPTRTKRPGVRRYRLSNGGVRGPDGALRAVLIRPDVANGVPPRFSAIGKSIASNSRSRRHFGPLRVIVTRDTSCHIVCDT